MKRILFLFGLLLVSVLGMAQAPSNYTNINGRYRWIAGMFDSTFHIPKGTTPSIRVGGSTNAGALFYRTTDSTVRYWTGSQWLTVADTTRFVPYVGATKNVNLGQYGIKTKYVEFDTSSRAVTDRTLLWSNDDGVLQYGMTNGGSLTQRIGLEQFARVRNVDATQINKGDVVYIFSASGDRASVKKADNRQDATSSKTLGVAAENIPVNDVGFVGTFGVVGNLNLAAYTAGDILYLDSIPGKVTKTKPQAPYHLVFIGVVERANAGDGRLFVNVQNGYELEELHNVKITSPVRNNSILSYDSVRALWVDTTINALGYVPYTGATTDVNLNTKTLSSGYYKVTGNNVSSGGYLAFQQYNGTSSGLSGHTTISALSRNSLILTYAQTSGEKGIRLNADSIVTGNYYDYYFPNKGGTLALTSDITGAISGTTNYIPKFTGSNSLGNSVIYESGGSIGIGTTSPSYTLDVNGTGRFSDNVRAKGTGNYTTMIVDNSSSATIGGGYFSLYSFGVFRGLVGTTGAVAGSADKNISIFAEGGSGMGAINFHVNGSGTPTHVMTSGGNVGIGTSSPSEKLEVYGKIAVNTSGQARTISTYYGANSDGYNIFIGGGGNSSVGAVGETYKGAYNTSIGVNALYSNTTGYYNSAMGAYALYYNTTGYLNSAMGASALFYNTTGYYNSAMGVNALVYNTTGYSNTGIGVGAGYSPTDNIDNKRITTDYNMTLLGYGATKNSASQLNNSIAIGVGTLVTASNTAMWGNASMSTHIFQSGNLEVTAGSIKTAAPSGGTAQPWKLGNVVATAIVLDDQYINVEINGVTYNIPTCHPN